MLQRVSGSYVPTWIDGASADAGTPCVAHNPAMTSTTATSPWARRPGCCARCNSLPSRSADSQSAGEPAEPDDTRPIVFVAGGTGFAPVKSLLDDMARRRVEREITLIRGARDASGLYLPGTIDKWRKHWPQMRYIPAISDAPVQPVAGAFAGRADEALRANCPDLSGHVLHCCGSPAMVSAVRAAALDLGLLAADFHADVFVPGAATPGP